MPSKRKRDILDFDPNKSDSDDTNFVPGADDERPRRTKKKQKGGNKSHRSTGGGRRRNRYRGSDIEEDDDDLSEESAGESFIDDDDEDDDLPLTSTGRRARKAAVNHQSYRESSEDSEDTPPPSDSDSEADKKPAKTSKAAKTSRKGSSAAEAAPPETVTKTSPRPSRIVTLKASPRKLRERIFNNSKMGATGAVPSRRTRGNTAEAEEFVELSNSGRHAQPARASSRSMSPDALAAGMGSRTRRASKGIKKPPIPAIEEATHESSVLDDVDELAVGGDGVRDSVESHEPGEGEANVEESVEKAEENAKADASETVQDITMQDGEEEDDDDDVQPLNRRTRQTRAAAAAEAEAEADAEGEAEGEGEAAEEGAEEGAEEAGDEAEGATTSRRLTRGSRRHRKAKSAKEPSSDFEPMDDDDSGEGENESDGSQKDSGGNNGGGGGGGGDDSSQNSRGRRRSTRLSSKRRHSEDEDDVDRDEVAMEAEELRASSRSRTRRRKRSPSIVYEQTSRRRTTKVVDYSIKPLDQFLLEQEEEEPEPAQTPARRRNARNGNGSTWNRNLLSTFGPFGGGGGDGSLIGGPWGTGAAGNVDSDSSDDEMINRTGGGGGGAGGIGGGLGGNVGMTPTAGGGGGGGVAGAAGGAGVTGFAAPLNLEAITGVAANSNVGKIKNQKALADADPLGVDMTVDFSKVGGLQNHINQLKEMVTLPLLYPELFLRFKVTPPRGVLFHGPPGTGKTLLARALANSVGVGGRKITFYMRKGADALSKWVGEAEKQLRLLFEEARRTQPSIIFFDEIDGLAPVRSSKQEQIHASIVSTLLALMDGMDGRGQVIVIGATNRPDNIDPALRRPGRFDREFYFPLPDAEGRRSILDIHTKDWGLEDSFKDMLAEQTKGYGGADLRALCTEAALNAIQRTYPQIYSSTEKLIVQPETIHVQLPDFLLSMKRMIPSSARSVSPAWAALPKAVQPLLADQFADIVDALDGILPRPKKTTALEEAMLEPYDDADHGFGRENLAQVFERARVFRPRLLLSGVAGMGQAYLSAALLHHLEGVYIRSFDLPELMGDGRPLEQVIVSLFVEVKRHEPAVIFLPNIHIWYQSLPASAYITFLAMLRSIPPTDPVLVLGTSECDEEDVPQEILKDVFGYSTKNRYPLQRPSKNSRRKYFEGFLEHVIKDPSQFPDPASRKRRVLEQLPVAPPPPPHVKTKAEIKEEERKDKLLLNLLKVQLQPIMDQIKKYKKFRQAAIPDAQISYLWQDADPNYVQPDILGADQDVHRPFLIAKDKEGVSGLLERATGKFYYNLDLTTIEERLSNGYYARPKDFYWDVVSLAKDAKNLGDKERLLKANELATNVEVDVAEAEARLSQINWEELYRRQLQRTKEKEEKAAKRRAGLAIVSGSGSVHFEGAGRSGDDVPLPLVTSDVVEIADDNDNDNENENENEQEKFTPQQIQQQARFQVKPGFAPLPPKETTSSTGSNGFQHPLSNGTSSFSSTPPQPAEDVAMTDSSPSGGGTTGGPTSAPALQRLSSILQTSNQNASNAADTQLSQVSALTGIPAGMSPSAVVNEASTTKSSGPWSTQATNGMSSVGSGGGVPGSTVGPTHDNVLPDTQSQSLFGSGPSQAPSSGDWLHSQADAIARGDAEMKQTVSGSGRPSGMMARILNDDLTSSPPQPRSSGGVGTAPTAGGSGSSSNVTPLGPPPRPQPQTSGANGSANPSTNPSASAGSGSSNYPISVSREAVDEILETILARTSGCTVDQLEQISRELMTSIWKTRHLYNRQWALTEVSNAFNRTMTDMEDVQGLTASFSQ